MIKLVIRSERCKNCGLCMSVCPKGNLRVSEEMNEIGYHPVTECQAKDCTGCGLCALMCPEMVFSIYRVKEEAKTNE